MNSERIDNRFSASLPEPAANYPEESLVNDARAGLTPAQMVDRKLVSLLPGAPHRSVKCKDQTCAVRSLDRGTSAMGTQDVHPAFACIRNPTSPTSSAVYDR